MSPAKGAPKIFGCDWSEFEPRCRGRGSSCMICVDNRILKSADAGHDGNRAISQSAQLR